MDTTYNLQIHGGFIKKLKIKSQRILYQERGVALLVNTDDLQILTNLGLSPSQARACLTLIDSGLCAARMIAYLSKISRQDVYQTVLSPQEMGLVEKTIDTPAKFKSVSIENAVSTLMRLREEKMAEKQENTRKLIGKFSGTKNNYPEGRTRVYPDFQEGSLHRRS